MSKTGLATVPAGDIPAVNLALRSLLAREQAIALIPPQNTARARAILTAISPEQPVAENIGLVAATSGSTGEPKAVLISYDAITASISAVNEELGAIPQWHLVIPVQHIAGTMTALRGLSPESQLHQPTINAADPMQLAAYAKSVKDLSGLHAIALVPEHLNRLDVINELSSLRYFHKVIVGAGKLSEALKAKLDSSGVEVVSSYGLTETCGGIVWDGKPLSGVSVSLNDKGEVLIQSPMNATGYRNSDEDLTTINSHDLGSFESGRLEILGRSDNKVKVKGHFIDLNQLQERAAEATQNEVAALLINDELHLVITNAELDESKLVADLIDDLGNAVKGCRIHYRDKLPRTDLGKLDLFSLRLELTSD